MRYRTKPFEVDAIQWLGRDSKETIESAFPDIRIELDYGYDGEVIVWDFLQKTWVEVNEGDYIIRGMKNEYYPCDAEVFERKYEPID